MDIIAFLEQYIQMWGDISNDNSQSSERRSYAEGKHDAYKHVLSNVISGYLEV